MCHRHLGVRLGEVGWTASPQLSVFLHELAFSFGKISHKTSEDSSSFMIYSYTNSYSHTLL